MNMTYIDVYSTMCLAHTSNKNHNVVVAANVANIATAANITTTTDTTGHEGKLSVTWD